MSKEIAAAIAFELFIWAGVLLLFAIGMMIVLVRQITEREECLMCWSDQHPGTDHMETSRCECRCWKSLWTVVRKKLRN